jgi:hypothetical protein
MATSPSTFVDTFMIGQLTIGTYSLMQKAYRSSTSQNCVKVDSNIVLATFYVGSTGLLELHSQNQIIIFPNPAHDKLSIIAENIDLNYCKVDLINLMGQSIPFTPENNCSLVQCDIEDLPSGIYLLKINNKTGLETIKFIKQ